MQRNAGNRTWQTEDNAIVGEELETGSFQHKHVIMTVPSKHRLDKLIADVCTSQMVVDRTDAHNQTSWVSIYSLARGQLDRNARERTPAIGSMTIGKYHNTPEYLKRKLEYYDKRRERNIEKAKTIQTEATEVHASISPDEIESLLINQNPDCRQRGGDSDFSVSKVRIWLKDKGYGEVPYWRVQMGTASANEHARLKRKMESSEKAS